MKARIIVALSILMLVGFVDTSLADCGSCGPDAPKKEAKKEIKQGAKKKAKKGAKKEVKQDSKKPAKKVAKKKAKKPVQKNKKAKNAAASCKACPCPIGNVLATLDLDKKQQVKIDKARQRLMTTIEKTLTPKQMKQFKKACNKKAAPPKRGK